MHESMYINMCTKKKVVIKCGTIVIIYYSQMHGHIHLIRSYLPHKKCLGSVPGYQTARLCRRVSSSYKPAFRAPCRRFPSLTHPFPSPLAGMYSASASTPSSSSSSSTGGGLDRFLCPAFDDGREGGRGSCAGSIAVPLARGCSNDDRVSVSLSASCIVSSTIVLYVGVASAADADARFLGAPVESGFRIFLECFCQAMRRRSNSEHNARV